MNKQEEIREGIRELINKNTVFFEGKYSPLAGPITSDRREMWCKPSYLANKILSYLHSQGVVIKVDGELDEAWIRGLKGKLKLTDWDYEDVMLYLLRSGYVATEPLVVHNK